MSFALTMVLTVAMLLSGCSLGQPGGLVTQTKDITDFTRVEVSAIYQVSITQASSFSISTSADKDLVDYIAVSKEGDILKIYLNPRHPFTDFTSGARNLKATITMPALSGLTLSGAAKATVSGFKSSEDFSLNVSGASSVTIDKVEVGNTVLKAAGASKVTGNIKAANTDFDVSGASQIELDGSADNVTLIASGASRVNLPDLVIDNAIVDISGSSEATLNVRDRLYPTLNDASRLFFRDNPQIDNPRVFGASTLKHE